MQPTRTAQVMNDDQFANQSEKLLAKTTHLPFLIIVTFLITAIIFGLGGYYLGKQAIVPSVGVNSQTAMLPSSTPTPSPSQTSPLPNPSPDITANWKTYKNNAFTFKYPSFLPDITLRAKGYGEESSPDIWEASYLDPNQRGGSPGYTVLFRVIGPSTNLNKLTLEKWIEFQSLNTGDSGEQLPRTIKKITLDSKEAIAQTGISSGFTVPTEFNLYFSHGNNIYTIAYVLSTNEEGAKQYQGDFDNIISTFKFTNN